MKKRTNRLLCVVAVFLLLVACAFLIRSQVGLQYWQKPNYYLPPEEEVLEQFENHRPDYLQFVSLLRKDPATKFIDSDGNVDIDSVHSRAVPEYRRLAHAIGAKDVIIREDGSIEFALWGNGGAIMSDSYMGVRYYPKDHNVDSHPGWTQTVVTSLDSAKLPKENGAVATGLYVVQIEPEWYLYRFEYQE